MGGSSGLKFSLDKLYRSGTYSQRSQRLLPDRWSVAELAVTKILGLQGSALIRLLLIHCFGFLSSCNLISLDCNAGRPKTLWFDIQSQCI